MRVLIVGSGGREHALAWKLSQEAEVFACPGNPGIGHLAKLLTCSLEDLPAQALELKVDLVVVGPENPLLEGIADRFRAVGLPTFGPGHDGAMLEGSKEWSKELMWRAGVPTAEFETCRTIEEAREVIQRFSAAGKQVAVKASGLAFGKGVVVCATEREALDAVEMMMVDRELGAAADSVVIEERLNGREFSLFSICSGTSFVSLPVAQDYKRILDGDRGPNTGGMGSYSPVDWVTPEMVDSTERHVVKPMLNELKTLGIDYRGVLFSGLLVQEGKIYCLEYNVRFGDPEIQSLVRRVGEGFGDLLLAAANGQDLTGWSLDISDEAAVTVCMASPGYPGSYPKGIALDIPEMAPEVVVFHAGTSLVDDRLVSSGGRVLAVSATGKSVGEARARAYRACDEIEFEGGFYRRDIAAE